MRTSDGKTSDTKTLSDFNHSYVVLSILLLLTIGSTLTYYQNSGRLPDDSGPGWTPVVFLIGICVSLLIFGMTRREAAARSRLEEKTRDLIEAQKKNESLLESEQQSRMAAERANEAKDEFLAVVSHELKTPLNAIAGWTRVLRNEGISNETRAAALEKIDKNLRIQTAIVEELLNFSDIMSSGLTMVKRAVRMRDIFEDAVAAVKAAAVQKGITLASDDRLDGERVLGDPARLKIAIANVLENAVKFTPPGGSIEAKAFDADGCVTCIVSDNGSGIPSEFLPYVFDQYRQSEHASTRHHSGLGLGLTIADHIIKLHHGTIQAESPGPGHGAKFTIVIPSRHYP